MALFSKNRVSGNPHLLRGRGLTTGALITTITNYSGAAILRISIFGRFYGVYLGGLRGNFSEKAQIGAK